MSLGVGVGTGSFPMGRMEETRDDGDMTDTTHTQPQPTRRLQRSREDRILTGVSGGLGAHLGINAWWIRLAFLVLTFFGGFGLLIYVAAWLLIPDQGAQDPIISQWLGRLDTNDGGTIFGLVLVGAAIVIILTQFADVSGTLVVAAILFVVGLLLYRGDLTPRPSGSPDASASAGDTPSPPEGASMVDHRDDDLGASAATSAALAVDETPPIAPVPPAAPAPPPPPPPPIQRERSMLGRLTIAIGLIVIASMALIDVAFDTVEIEPVHYLATAVGITGLGLIVGAWIGKARWLILVGILILPAMWFTSLWPSDFSFSAGEVREEPISVSEVATPYELGFGQLTLDLGGLTETELAAVGEIDVTLGMGELILRLPADVGVAITADVGMGALQGPFAEEAGIGIDAVRIVGPEPVVYEINAEVGAGVITVEPATLLERSFG